MTEEECKELREDINDLWEQFHDPATPNKDEVLEEIEELERRHKANCSAYDFSKAAMDKPSDELVERVKTGQGPKKKDGEKTGTKRKTKKKKRS